MSRRAGKLPEHWDKPIPEALWPETLLTAVRHDLGALTSERVQQTLQKWRESLSSIDPSAQREARRRLLAVGNALLGTPDLPGDPVADDRHDPASDAFTVDAFPTPKARSGRRTGQAMAAASARAPAAASGRPAPDAPGRAAAAGRVAPVQPSAPAAPDHRVAARAPAKSSDLALDAPARAKPSDGPARPAPAEVSAAAFFEESEPPTTHVPLPSSPAEGLLTADIAAELGTIDGVPPPTRAPRAADEGTEKPTAHIALPGDPPAWEVSESPARAISAVTPAKQVARRRSVRGRGPSNVRPRAAMHHVKALHAVLMPFAEELVPLGFERRSRRFWARWREVAGDHGVRRPFVEDLLRTASDARTMVCELIAEVHSVDPASVAALVDQIARKPSRERSVRRRSHARGVLVQAHGPTGKR